MAGDKLLNLFPPVDRASIPQQDHRPSKMLKQEPKKCPDIKAVDIPGAMPDIQGNSLSFWGHRKGADGRYPVLFVEMVEEWRLTLRPPGASDCRDEQKAAFIKKGQMGPTFFRVFLYVASDTASSWRLPFRPAGGHGAPVSDSSIPGFPGASRHGMDGTKCRIAGRSLRPHAVMSTSPSDNQRPEGLLKASSRACPSVPRSAWADGLEWVGVLTHPTPFLDMTDAIGTPSLLKSLGHVPPPTDSCPLLTSGLPVGAAFPAVVRFPEVSCLVLYQRLYIFSIIYAKVNSVGSDQRVYFFLSSSKSAFFEVISITLFSESNPLSLPILLSQSPTV